VSSGNTIADAFVEPHWPTRRYHYWYVRGKLASDPLYPAVVASLRGSDAPLLDVLQYLPDAAQERVLGDAIAMLVPGSRLAIRSGLHDDSARSRTTGRVDRLANAIGWMRSAPLRYPTRDWFERRLAVAGLAADFRPLHGRTPFNNWLVVATR
jgi:hypothetical protein